MRCTVLMIGGSNMSDYNYEIIKESVMEWYEKISSDVKNENNIIVSTNNNDALIIDFDFENCIAQLSVTNSQFVPYQFVYFEAMDIEISNEEEKQPVYCFYDDENMQKSDVMDALNEAVRFCIAYKMT